MIARYGLTTMLLRLAPLSCMCLGAGAQEPQVYSLHEFMNEDGFACPSSCPYEAEDLRFSNNCTYNNGSMNCGCHVQCVRNGLCGTDPFFNHSKNIEDEVNSYCSGCRVSNCLTCEATDPRRCTVCNNGYSLGSEASCIGLETYIVNSIVAVIMIAVMVFLVWYIELRCRPTENSEGVKEGLHHRDLVMVGQEHGLFTMNLLQNPIGGAGSVLFFRYHISMVLWGLCLFAVWLAMNENRDSFVVTPHDEAVLLDVPSATLALRSQTRQLHSSTSTVDLRGAVRGPNSRDDLFVGSYTVSKTSDVCTVVAVTHLNQCDAMDAQFWFTVLAWALTFLFFVGLAFKQFWKFLHLDNGSQMSDFCLMCCGLPQLSGPDVEKDLFAFFSQEFGASSVLGVSVCWDFQDQAEEVRDAIDADTYDAMMESDRLHNNTKKSGGDVEMAAIDTRASTASKELLNRPSSGGSGGAARELRKPTKHVNKVRQGIRVLDLAMGFKPPKKKNPKELWKKAIREVRAVARLGGKIGAAEHLPSISKVLLDMKCSGEAFIVFNTEDQREEAAKAKGVRYDGNLLVFKEQKVEPETVNWGNFHIEPPSAFRSRAIKGVAGMVFLLFLYATVFYYPYYLVMMSQNASQRPTGYSLAYFTNFFITNFGTMVVVLGNQIMYYAAGAVADYMGFLFEDSAQTVYVVLYNAAVLTQTAIDLYINYWVSWNSLMQLGYRTHDGRLMTDDMSFAETARDVTVQASVGYGFSAYCFPSCFLIPFMIEPVMVYFFPYHLQKCLVSAHPWVRGHVAEQKLDFLAPMDLSRYGDIMLNVILVTIGFVILPASQLRRLLGTFAVCHLYIFFYDYYRILRLVPGFCISNNLVYRAIEYFMVIPTSVLAVAMVVRRDMNSHLDKHEDVPPELPWAKMVGAFFSNAIVFWAFVGFPGTDIGLVPWIVNRSHQHEVAAEDFETYAQTNPASWFTTNPVHCLRTKYVHGHKTPCGYFVRGMENLLRRSPKANAYYGNPSRTSERKPWATQEQLWA